MVPSCVPGSQDLKLETRCGRIINQLNFHATPLPLVFPAAGLEVLDILRQALGPSNKINYRTDSFHTEPSTKIVGLLLRPSQNGAGEDSPHLLKHQRCRSLYHHLSKIDWGNPCDHLEQMPQTPDFQLPSLAALTFSSFLGQSMHASNIYLGFGVLLEEHNHHHA
jgi:hypothetical protein